jgi:hypothetical protein
MLVGETLEDGPGKMGEFPVNARVERVRIMLPDRKSVV